MSIKKYEVLVKVVELGSLTKAAEASGCSQSAVSHILNDLESEFGFTILKRSRGGVQLTENGGRILPAIRGILNYNQQLSQTVASIHGLDTGVIHIGAVTSVAVHWLPGILKQFVSEHPSIELKLYNGDYGDISRWLNEGSIDVGFLALPAEVNCECIPLMEDRMLAVLPKDHPMADLPKFPVAQVAREPFISLLESSDQDTRRILQAAGITPDIRFTTKDDYAIIAMVEQGLGMSIMPELLLKNHRENVAVLELLPKSSRLIGLAVPNASRSSPATRAFVDCVVDWIKTHIQ